MDMADEDEIVNFTKQRVKETAKAIQKKWDDWVLESMEEFAQPKPEAKEKILEISRIVWKMDEIVGRFVARNEDGSEMRSENGESIISLTEWIEKLIEREPSLFLNIKPKDEDHHKRD